jgi:hypothetical protein
MARLDLGRLVRGGHRRALEEVLGLLPAPARLVDERGKVLLGPADAVGGVRAPVVVGGAEVGAVIGEAGVERAARVIQHLYEREQEKHALAAETLGRYKELTLVYDMSNALSRVLDVDDVAKMIVGEAHRFLHASEAALFTVDRRRELLEPLADVGGARATTFAEAGEVEARVLRTGQAEFVDEDAGSVMVAPLRSGEAVFGLLRVRTAERGRWVAGDLKLVTSLASNAAAAISHAMLHRDQLRQQELRNQIERFVPPALVDVALEGRGVGVSEPLAVLFCDVGTITRSLDRAMSASDMVAALHAATTTALDVLVGHGASVGAAHGEMLVALFGQEPDFTGSADRAASAASEIVRRLDRRFGGALDRSPGVGIARVDPSAGEGLSAFYEGVGVAATLQAAADGRILVEDPVASVLVGAWTRASVDRLAGPSGMIDAHEIHP